jgi:hypothetical protein
MRNGLLILACLALIFSADFAAGQDSSRSLTDRIQRGSGTINLLRNLSAGSLADYLNMDGTLRLGIDVSENASGNESNSSLGIAIKSLELILVTTAGTFSFDDVFTGTIALIRESGTPQDSSFNVLLGQSGRNSLTSSTPGFDLRKFDDVIQVRNIEYEGSILSANVNVTFLDTPGQGRANDEFFDFSGGSEDFSLLSTSDAAALDALEIGHAEARSNGVTFLSTSGGGDDGGGSPSPGDPPGGPAPPLILLLAAGAAAMAGRRRFAPRGL